MLQARVISERNALVMGFEMPGAASGFEL